MARRRKKHPRKWHKRNETKRADCPSGKNRYADRGQADATIRRRDMDAYSYRCPSCKGWHIASTVGRKERQRRARGEDRANPA